jgi:50S ribosomal protein L16 3-hydroxylase
MHVTAPPDAPAPALGDLSPETFLEDYWQQRPLVIREALHSESASSGAPGFTSPLAPEELAGLALEDGVESRLILKEGGAYPWELRHGPFSEEDFRALPEENWTLLVQAVDQLVPAVERLLEHFRFLPRWRLDDVMVSYAPAGGGVGAHLDHYDVFLVQGKGRRRWRFGHAPVKHEEIVPDLDVRMLKHFEPDEEVILEAGDLLYLPPRVAHHGTSVSDDCMTYSVGLRAPSHAEILVGYARACAEQLAKRDRFADPDRTAPPEHIGEIDAAAREQVRRIVREAASNEQAVDRWFGRHVTRPPAGEPLLSPDAPPDADALVEAIRSGTGLRPTPGARLAFFENENGGATLFAGGEAYDLLPRLAFAAPLLADRRLARAEVLRPHLDTEGVPALLAQLVTDGALERFSPEAPDAS